jgi:hypothetical protein
MTTTKLFAVSDAQQAYCPECFVPSPRTTRKKTIAKTTMSAYSTMTKLPRFLYAIDKLSLGATPAKRQCSSTPDDFADPALTPLLQRLQNMLGVDASGDELRAILDHRGENSFSIQIHERHVTNVNDALAGSILTV